MYSSIAQSLMKQYLYTNIVLFSISTFCQVTDQFLQDKHNVNYGIISAYNKLFAIFLSKHEVAASIQQ